MAHMQGRTGVPPLYAGKHLGGYGAQHKAAAEVAALAEKIHAIDVDGDELSWRVIKVKTLTGRVIDVYVEPTDAVGRIKERVEEQEGIPPEQQRLIFGGKQLADGKTVRESNLKNGAFIHLVLALRGGGRYYR